MILASTQQNLAVAFVVALVLGWALFLLLSVKKSGERVGDEAATAPNRRPYFDDDALEGPRLERAQKGALAMLIVVVLGLPLYWLDEPSRQAGAVGRFRQARRAPRLRAVPAVNVVDSRGQHRPLRLRWLPRHRGRGRRHRLRAHRRRRHEPVGAVGGAGARHRPAPLHRGRGQHDHHLRPGQHADAGVGRRRRRPDERAAGHRHHRVPQVDPADGQGGAGGIGGAWAPTAPTLFDQFCSRCHTKGWSYDEPERARFGRVRSELARRRHAAAVPRPPQAHRVRHARVGLSRRPTAPAASAPAACPASVRCCPKPRSGPSSNTSGACNALTCLLGRAELGSADPRPAHLHHRGRHPSRQHLLAARDQPRRPHRVPARGRRAERLDDVARDHVGVLRPGHQGS